MQLPVRMIGFMNGLVYCGISTCSCHVRMTGLMHAVMTVKSDSPSIQWPRFANPGIVIKMTTKTTFDHHAAALETSDCIKRQQFSSLAPHLDQIKGNKLLLKWRQGKRTLFIDTTYGRKKRGTTDYIKTEHTSFSPLAPYRREKSSEQLCGIKHRREFSSMVLHLAQIKGNNSYVDADLHGMCFSMDREMRKWMADWRTASHDTYLPGTDLRWKLCAARLACGSCGVHVYVGVYDLDEAGEVQCKQCPACGDLGWSIITALKMVSVLVQVTVHSSIIINRNINHHQQKRQSSSTKTSLL